MSPDEMMRSYEEALTKTEASAVRLDPVEHETAMARMQSFFSHMRADKVHALAREVYAPDAYLNDSLKVVSGVAAIEDYFANAAEKSRDLHFELVDFMTSSDGPDYYLRWRMRMERSGLNGGAPIEAAGVSHLRFDSVGRLILHRDFWNTGTAFYERIPVLGWLIRRVRARI